MMINIFIFCIFLGFTILLGFSVLFILFKYLLDFGLSSVCLLVGFFGFRGVSSWMIALLFGNQRR